MLPLNIGPCDCTMLFNHHHGGGVSLGGSRPPEGDSQRYRASLVMMTDP